MRSVPPEPWLMHWAWHGCGQMTNHLRLPRRFRHGPCHAASVPFISSCGAACPHRAPCLHPAPPPPCCWGHKRASLFSLWARSCDPVWGRLLIEAIAVWESEARCASPCGSGTVALASDIGHSHSIEIVRGNIAVDHQFSLLRAYACMRTWSQQQQPQQHATGGVLRAFSNGVFLRVSGT